MESAPNPVSYGDNLSYTLTVTNQGELQATGVTLNDSLPQGAVLVSATASQGSCSGTGPIICSLGNLSAGGGATLTIVIKPPASKTITNTATVSRNEPELNQSNNTASVNTQVIFADLSVSKSAASDGAAPGSKIIYFITASNTSGTTTGSVTVSDNLSAEVTFVSCNASAGGVCGGTGNNRSITFPSLAEGASAMAVIVATLNNSVTAGTVINNTASANAALPDPNQSNNSALSAVTATNTPVKLRQNGKIATDSDRAFSNSTQPSGIYVINPDGTGELQLLNVQPFLSAPAWSPDGTRIAYGQNAEPGQNRSELYVARADGTNPIRVATDVFDRNTRAAWSPNGKKLAYIGSDFAIHLVNANGTGAAKLPNSPTFINDLSWSPDGAMFAYSDGTDIFKMNLDGSGQTNLTQGRPVNNSEPTRSSLPRWSPDGTRLLFQGTSNNYRNTYVMNADGSGLAQLFGISDSQDPAWSPDGTKITYISQNSLYVANTDGTNPTQVTHNGFYNYKPDWQPLPAPLPALQLSAPAYSVAENAGVATINVTRSGDASRALTVDYATSDGTA
jgi:uncharacterized repeat protein (TIGR01451 family)